MKKGQTSSANFFNIWLSYKIEKLQEIEHLCTAIMDVLQITDDSSDNITLDGLIEGEIGNRKFAAKIHFPIDTIDWVKHFEKFRIGKRIAECKDLRHGHGKEQVGDFKTLFHQHDPGWRQTCYGEDLGSFQAIRNDCRMMSQLLRTDVTGCGEMGFKAIDGTVTSLAESTFTLIGIHDKEHEITPKLREHEAREQERKKADEVMRKGRVKGGRVPKKNAAILEAVKEFIIEKRKRIGQKAATIARTFKVTYDSSQPLEITVDSIKYEVYCDGKEVCSRSATGKKGKYHDKTISYSSLMARYIPEAKTAVSSSNSLKS